MHEEKNTKSRAAIALLLCFAVIVLTSAFAVKSSIDKISDSAPDPGSTVTDTPAPVENNNEASSETTVIDSNSSREPGTADDGSALPDYIKPVDGEIILKYSMDSLVYSKTLDQYMTHPGIDIRADLSSNVSAIADGTVTRVENDDRYGVTVYITHGDGLISSYSNLAEHGLAETGDEVRQGDYIGCIGDTALFESLDEAHLHFEIEKDGNPADPGDYIEEYKSE